jgi:membrane protein YqaA with SNARE-associated domain
MHFIAVAAAKAGFWHMFRRLGGPGLILLGLLDNSAIPLPGSMDALTLVLAASHKDLWWYYAIMATIGSLVGGYLTYRIGVRGGKATLEKKISKRRAEKVYRKFEKYAFWSVVVGAVSPPPVPIVPFLIAAGALKYPKEKFLTALALGRSIRYFLIAYLGSLYGRTVFNWLGKYYQPLLYTLIGLGVVGGLVALFLWRRSKRKPGRGSKGPATHPAERVA